MAGHMILYGFLYSLACILTSCDRPNKEKNSGALPAADVWRFTGFGGGGGMYYPTISPHNPHRVFLSCDMTGAYASVDGGNSWRMFNIHGVVKYYVFDPLDSNVVYASSIALFRSADRGQSWNLLYPALSEIAGIVSKGDHAEETLITKDSSIRHVLAMAVDPGNSKKLYAVIGIDSATAFYSSDNTGASWTMEHRLPEDAQDIFIVPSSSIKNRTVYITGRSGLSVRDIGVWSFKAVPEGIAYFKDFSGGADRQRNTFGIYAITANANKNKDGMLYSEDGGASWKDIAKQLVFPGACDDQSTTFRGIATSAFHPQTVYVSYSNMGDSVCLGVAKSMDRGTTWQLPWKDMLIMGSGSYSKSIMTGWIDDMFDATWGENPFSIGVSPADPEICYTTDCGRVIKTVNGGNSWDQVYTKKNGQGWSSRGLEVTTNYGVLFDPFNNKHVFLLNTDVGLMESEDGGKAWKTAMQDNGVPDEWKNTAYWLTFDPKVNGKAWAAMSETHDLPRPKMWRNVAVSQYRGGILLTEDGGKSWKPVSADIGQAAVTHILLDTLSDTTKRILYACAFGKGVYRSSDGGRSWQRKNKGIESEEPFAWRIIQRPGDRALFLILSRRNDDGSVGVGNEGALYRSDDGAESWKKSGSRKERMRLPAWS